MTEDLRPPPLTATWSHVFAPPLAWFASQQVSYALVPWACAGGPTVAIPVANLVALLIVACAGALAWRDWRTADPGRSDEGEPPAGRARFLGLLSLMLCFLFTPAIVAQTMGAFVFDPCQR